MAKQIDFNEDFGEELFARNMLTDQTFDASSIVQSQSEAMDSSFITNDDFKQSVLSTTQNAPASQNKGFVSQIPSISKARPSKKFANIPSKVS